MNEIRKQKLESTLRKQLAELILRRRAKDDRVGFVSVTRVILAPDLAVMTAHVSFFGDDEDQIRTRAALDDAASDFQSSLGRGLRLRRTPRLVFARDDSIQEGDRIVDILESG